MAPQLYQNHAGPSHPHTHQQSRRHHGQQQVTHRTAVTTVQLACPTRKITLRPCLMHKCPLEKRGVACCRSLGIIVFGVWVQFQRCGLRGFQPSLPHSSAQSRCGSMSRFCSVLVSKHWPGNIHRQKAKAHSVPDAAADTGPYAWTSFPL